MREWLMRRKIAWYVSLVVLAITGVLGVYNGITEWGDGDTAFQQSVTVGVLIYGIFGLITTYGLLRRQRWSLLTAAVWAICVIYVPGFAVMAYDNEASLGSALTASGASTLIAVGVLWTVNVITRDTATQGAIV